MGHVPDNKLIGLDWNTGESVSRIGFKRETGEMT